MEPCAVRPFGPDEQRLLGVITRPDGNENRVCLIHRRDNDHAMTATGEQVKYVAATTFTDRPDDPPMEWFYGATAEDVVIRVAEAWVNAPPPPGVGLRASPEVECYMKRFTT